MHFSISLAWYTYDKFGDKNWQKPERDWSITLDNADFTTDQLVTAFRRKLKKTIKRDEVKARLKPEEPGEWFLSHSDPSIKAGPCEVDN